MSNRRAVLKAFEDHKEYIEKQVVEGIENYRKTNATLRIIDAEGNPIAGKKVTVKQTNHEFRYGANLFMLDEFECEEKNKLYRELFAQCANMATLPFYWRDLEPEKGKPRYAKDSPKVYRRPALDLCIEYCKEKGIEPKEHCLMYEEWYPTWLDTANLAEMKEALENRFRDLALHYANDIPGWEVTNETLYAFKECTAFYNEPDLIEWCFACAEKYLQNNKLIINDAHCNIWDVFNWRRSAYYMQIERALLKGARIDSIGMQFHMFFPREDEAKETAVYYNPTNIYNVLDCYADFSKPIQITEMTIPAYSCEPEDESIQAEIMKWLYSIWFSHPSVEAIMYWNLVDGYAAFAPQGDMTAGENYYHGGLLRFDMSPKPAFYTVKNLFEKEWHTEETLETDASGNLSFNGFYGDYEIIIHVGDKTETKTLSLTKNGDKEFQMIL